jgi:hypothetical protein
VRNDDAAGLSGVKVGKSMSVAYQSNPGVQRRFWISAARDGSFQMGDDSISSQAH